MRYRQDLCHPEVIGFKFCYVIHYDLGSHLKSSGPGFIRNVSIHFIKVKINQSGIIKYIRHSVIIYCIRRIPLHSKNIASKHDMSLQWRNNERDCVSNHRRLHCLLNRFFKCISNKTPKPRVTGLCEGNSPVTCEFPPQRASNAENVSIWWRDHVILWGML